MDTYSHIERVGKLRISFTVFYNVRVGRIELPTSGPPARRSADELHPASQILPQNSAEDFLLGKLTSFYPTP